MSDAEADRHLIKQFKRHVAAQGLDVYAEETKVMHAQREVADLDATGLVYDKDGNHSTAQVVVGKYRASGNVGAFSRVGQNSCLGRQVDAAETADTSPQTAPAWPASCRSGKTDRTTSTPPASSHARREAPAGAG